MLRQCNKCDETLPLDNFEVTVKDADGIPKSRRGACKACYAAGRKSKVASAAAAGKLCTPSTTPASHACNKCGKNAADGAAFKWRTDNLTGGWRNECNECYNDKKYHVTHRERKMAENPEAYRRHNAEVHRRYREAHPERYRVQRDNRRKDSAHKIKDIEASANARGIPFAEADREAMQAKLVDGCHYCGFMVDDGEVLNGLDRVDPDLGYTDSNTVPACPTCNAMKACYTVDVFIHDMRAIACKRNRTPPDMACPRRRLVPLCGSAEAREAPDVDKTNNLPDEVNIGLLSGQCYLCGRSPALGIDRVDASLGYTANNVQSCCTSCNYHKKSMSLADFDEHVSYVAAHTSEWVIDSNVADAPLKLCNGMLRVPVEGTGMDGKSMVFPSISCASISLGVSKRAIQKALNVPSATSSGCTWVTVEPRVYNEQHIIPDDAATFLRTFRQQKVSK